MKTALLALLLLALPLHAQNETNKIGRYRLYYCTIDAWDYSNPEKPIIFPLQRLYKLDTRTGQT